MDTPPIGEEEPAGTPQPRAPKQRLTRLLRLPQLRKPAIFSRRASWSGSVEAPPWSAAKIALISSMATIAATAALLTALSLLLAQHDDAPVVAEIELPAAPPSAPLAPPAAGIDGGIIAPPYTPASFAGLAPLTASAGEVLSLAQAPDAALIEMTPAGALPRVGADGRQPRHVYARPFDRRDNRARLALIVLEAGLSRVATEAAIQRLPGAVVLAIDAYAASPESWAGAARRAGHEIIATIPLQAAATHQDAGPRALRIHAATEENAQKLSGGLSRFAGYTGVLFLGDGSLADDAERLEPLLRSLRDRGLLFVDGIGNGPSSPLVRLAKKLRLSHVPLDAVINAGSAASIDRQLEGLAAAALGKSFAVGAIYPTPVALERLRGFLARLDTTRLVLAPVSAVVRGGQEE